MPDSLYHRLGGYDAIAAVADDLLPRLTGDPQLARFVANGVTIPVLSFANLEQDRAKQGQESWQMLRAMTPR